VNEMSLIPVPPQPFEATTSTRNARVSALATEAAPQTIEVGGSADMIVRAGFILATVGMVVEVWAWRSVRSHWLTSSMRLQSATS
jgi:hypothetical protein